jgi:hypothetical protein
MNSFKVRLAHKHSLDTLNIKPLVIYILHKWGCPIEISTDSSKLLLLALGYVIDYVNLFQFYENRYSMTLPPYPTPEEMHEPTLNFITQNLPSYSSLDYPTILSLYNNIQKRIFACFEQIRYCNFLIHKSKASFPKAEIDELWVAKSEERVNDYAESLAVYKKNQMKREEELRHMTVFWSWLVLYM